MYDRGEKQKRKRILDNAKEALEKYENEHDTVSGIHLISYIKQGIVKIDTSKPENNEVASKMFSDWGSRNPLYIWLRLGKMGMLVINDEGEV